MFDHRGGNCVRSADEFLVSATLTATCSNDVSREERSRSSIVNNTRGLNAHKRPSVRDLSLVKSCCDELRMDVQASLIPGYTQVDEFQHESDYEDIEGEVVEEVEYITLDLGSVEPTLVPSSSSFRLVVSHLYLLFSFD